MRPLLFVCLLAVAAATGRAQPTTLLPVPRSATPGDGTLQIDSALRVTLAGVADPRLQRGADRFAARLAARSGMPVRVSPGGAGGRTIELRVDRAGQAVQGVDEDERYTLTVSPGGAVLHAATVVGALRGMETLLQLVVVTDGRVHLPAVSIDDAPRLPWRGLLLDVSRHFMSVEQVKRTLDGMAMVKLNVLHWHLTDDQGFRVESRRFPRLHRLGSDGQFYTQREIREIVAHARDRGIRVVPEFDMPGHTTSWFVGYPQYGTRRPPNGIRRAWGGADAIFDPTREATYTFLADFIAEMVTLFPDRYWHIGGDEVEARHWNGNRAIVAWRRRRGLRDNAALQAHFNRRLARILARHGKRMVGWDEILHPDLPPETVVQSWRGVRYLAESVKRGFPGILSAPWYLDHIKPASEYYAVDPVPQFDELTPEQQGLVLGGEAAMWTEYVSEETVDSRIWPRLGAVAERLWSPREVRDVADLYRRLDTLAVRLESVGIHARTHTARMLRRRAPGLDVTPVESLLTALQPPHFGQTRNGRRQTQLDPLDRLVDAARPDPPARWLVERLVRRLAVDASDAAARDSLTVLFTRWRDLRPAVHDLGARSSFLADAIPAADALSRLSEIALEALSFLAAGEAPPEGWVAGRSGEVGRLAGVHGTLRVAVAADVGKLLAILVSAPSLLPHAHLSDHRASARPRPRGAIPDG